MRTLRNALIAATMVAAITPDLQAQADRPGSPLVPGENSTPTRQGTRGANFLSIGVGARGNALAGAVVSGVTGPQAWYWNPAGGAATESFSVGVSRQAMYGDLGISHNFAGLAMPLGAATVLGVSWTQLSASDIDRSDPAFPFGNDPVKGDKFDFTSSAIGLHAARRLTDRLDVGIGAKYISEGISDASISWVGLDLGTQFRTGISGLVIGGALANIGSSSRVKGAAVERVLNTDDVSGQITTVQYRTQDVELPTAFRFSVGVDLLGGALSTFGQRGPHFLTGEVALNDAVDTDVQLAVGTEYSYANRFFLRGGKRFYNDDRATGSTGLYGLSGGVGLAIPLASRHLRFDYAYTSLGDLENVQVFSFELGR